MLKLSVMLLAVVMLPLAGCAWLKPQPVPVAVSCPTLPKPPEALTKSASHEPDLTKRYSDSLEKLRESLKKATLP